MKEIFTDERVLSDELTICILGHPRCCPLPLERGAQHNTAFDSKKGYTRLRLTTKDGHKNKTDFSFYNFIISGAWQCFRD